MTKWLPDLTTLDSVKENNGISATGDDAMLTRFIHEASVWFQNQCDRVFVPYYDEWTQDARGETVTPRLMYFTDEVLELASVTNGDGIAVAASEYRLLPSRTDPKYRIELLPSSGKSWNYTTDWQDAIAFTGTLGCHDNYSAAFRTLTTATGTLNTTDDALAVSSSASFEVLQYIKHAAGGELSQVTAVATGTLTLERGVLGTTAVAQSAGTNVQAYQENPDVQSAIDHLVGWMYDNRDTSGRTVQYIDGGSATFESAIPKYTMSVLENRMRREFP